ncbi:MAG: SDR family oxidoreductase [Burkholderiaceae bacterium]
MLPSCIIVTGASRGIGAAIATALARQGQTVACLSRSGALPAADPDTACRLLRHAADVTDPRQLRTVVDELAATYRIVGLVNNAGLHVEARSAELTVESWNAMMNTNALSTLSGCQAAYPHLVAAGGGLIVNIGSFFDKMGVKRNLAYCASKAAVGAITRCLAVEWASQGIRVIDVAPGYIQTDLNADAMNAGPLRAYLDKRIPRGRPGTADEVATLVASLFVQPTGFLSGETIYLDGAQGIAH